MEPGAQSPGALSYNDLFDGRRLTPMFKQYVELKEQVPDSVLLFRMGDFFEVFFEDAMTASKVCDLTLTARDKLGKAPIPMAGVPHRSVRGHIRKLVKHGYKVALADQVEDPKLARGLVRRAITEIITPGLVLEPDELDARAANYLVAVHFGERETVGVAFMDVSTGEFGCTDLDDLGALAAELDRLDPAEIVLSDEVQGDPRTAVLRTGEVRIADVPDHAFSHATAVADLCEMFGVRDLRGFGLGDMGPGVSAAGAILYYLRAARVVSLGHVRRLRPYRLDGFMVLDESTRRNLELFRTMATGKRKGSLVGLLDRAVTGMGSRRIRRWIGAPLLDPAAINARLEAVDILVGSEELRTALRERLELVHDIERLNGKVQSGRAHARDLMALRRSLEQVPAVDVLLDREDTRGLDPFAPLPDLAALREDIIGTLADDPPISITDGGLIRRGFHGELDELIDLSREGKGALARLEADERRNTGISSLKVRYNRVFGWYIEVTKANLAAVPEHYIRKQTLANAERYYTPELKEFEAKVLGAQERRGTLEMELFGQLRERVAAQAAALGELADRLANIDALAAFAELAVRHGYVRPVVDDSETLDLRGSRHPVIEQMRLEERFVPNDILLDATENQLLIVSGPNMAGKSTVMRQAALVVLLAQAGCFVPATEARIGVVDRIFTRVGASDNIARGQSTFMVEMAETAAILHHATSRSLCILDEIGRGTSTFDGLAIAWAVAEHIADSLRCRTMFATHYHELSELASTRPQVRNVNIAVSEMGDRVIFLRRLRDGGASRSYGIQVAKLAGLPEPVLERARQVLANLENDAADEIGRPKLARGREGDSPSPGQMSLFADRSSVLKDELLQIDVNELTPLEALNLLADLRAKAERL